MTTLVQARRTLRQYCIDRIHVAGVCRTVNGYEPKSAPSRGSLHAAVTIGQSQVLPQASGLATTSFRQHMRVRLMIALPIGNAIEENRVEEEIADGSATITDAMHAQIRVSSTPGIEFDPTGHTGLPLQGNPGYLEQDGTQFRIEDITYPFVIFDLWSQTP